MRLLLLAVALLVLPAGAQARTYPRPALPDPMPTVIRGECPGLPSAAGCFIGPTFTVYLDVERLPPDAVRYARLHELGHAIDVQHLDGGERHRFAWLIDTPGPWLASGTPREHDRAGEQWADYYAACRAGGYREIRGLCRFIIRAISD